MLYHVRCNLSSDRVTSVNGHVSDVTHDSTPQLTGHSVVGQRFPGKESKGGQKLEYTGN